MQFKNEPGLCRMKSVQPSNLHQAGTIVQVKDSVKNDPV